MKMRNASKLILVVAILFITNLKAQDKEKPWMIAVGVSAIDHYPTNIDGLLSDNGIQTEWFDQYFNTNHYNFGFKMSATRYLNKSFNAELSLTFSKIEKLGNINLDSSVSLFAIDLNGNYKLNALFGSTGFFEPYVLLGAGYTSQKSTNAGYPFNSTVSLNSGLGAKFWISDNFGVRIQSSLKYFFNNGSYRHFQHSASLIYKIGGDVDSDKDGINDKNDACPEVFGLVEFNGCPDTDGDGIVDSQDACPTVPGIIAERGCPELDNDGDGVVDSKDKCKYVPGAEENFGCPWPDTDGDGVVDKEDECPDEAGTSANKGCPVEVTLEAINALKELARTVYFQPEKAVFTPETAGRLDLIVAILSNYPNAKFHIEGHTDNSGTEYFNQILSDDRANAVRNYLIANGIKADNLTAKGYGGSMPIDVNTTESGKAMNRRVEIKLEQ
jgi:OOP family OmpA-OmpF porin